MCDVQCPLKLEKKGARIIIINKNFHRIMLRYDFYDVLFMIPFKDDRARQRVLASGKFYQERENVPRHITEMTWDRGRWEFIYIYICFYWIFSPIYLLQTLATIYGPISLPFINKKAYRWMRKLRAEKNNTNKNKWKRESWRTLLRFL